MEDPNSTLLPYILETLSRKPELCDTLENLCRDIEAQLKHEQNKNFGNVRISINRAINVGQSLGILTLTNDVLRVPFNFHVKAGRAPMVSHSQVQPPIGTGNLNQRGTFNQKGGRQTVQNQHPNNNNNNYGNNGTRNVPSNSGYDITGPPQPHTIPSRGRHRVSRSRQAPRRRARSRSTIRRRPYTRRRSIRARSRSSYSCRRRR